MSMDDQIWAETSADLNSKENPARDLPPEEEIDLSSIWVGECFPPSKVEALKTAVRNLGWDAAAGEIGLPEESVLNWIESCRTRSIISAFFPINVLVREESNDWIMVNLFADIPHFVVLSRGYIFYESSGLFIVVLQFILDDSFGKLITSTLSQQFQSISQPTKNGSRLITPTTLRRQALEEIRSHAREALARWFSQQLPGVFSDTGRLSWFPTAEFMTVKLGTPADHAMKRPWDSYLNLIGFGDSFDAWASEDIPGATLFYPERVSKRRFNMVLAGNEQAVFPDDPLAMHGGRNRIGISRAMQRFDSTFVTWCRHALLSFYESEYSDIRDKMTQLPTITDVDKASEAIRRIESRLMALSADVVTVGAEIRGDSENRHSFGYRNDDFFPTHPRRRVSQEQLGTNPILVSPSGRTLTEKNRRAEHGLAESIDFMMIRRCDWLLRIDTQCQGFVRTESAIMSSRSQERLARSNLWLQWFVLIATIIAVILTMFQSYLAWKHH